METKQLNGTPVTLISLQFQYDQWQEITYCVSIVPSTQFSHPPITVMLCITTFWSMKDRTYDGGLNDSRIVIYYIMLAVSLRVLM